MIGYSKLYDESKICFGKIKSNEVIFDLFKNIFNKEIDKDELNWFSLNPYGPNNWYAAFDGNRPIGMYGLLPIKVGIDDKVYNGALCNNVGIIRDYQGKGLFQALGEHALKEGNFPVVIGIPNAKAVKGHKRIGWVSYGKLELLSGKTYASGNKWLNSEPFQFLPRINKSHFHIVKDISFVKWRYSKPGIKYFQSIFKNGDYVIWKNYEGKKQILETSNYRLIMEMGGTVDIWQFRGTIASADLKAKGFEPILENEFIIYTDLPVANDLNTFNFELGDNDVF